MQAFIVSLPFILLGIFYIVLCFLNVVAVKVSGQLVGGDFVSWKQSFIFALTITVLTLIERIGENAAGASVSLVLEMSFSDVLFVALGSWYFSTRCTDNQGQALGWRSGVRITIVALFIFV